MEMTVEQMARKLFLAHTKREWRRMVDEAMSSHLSYEDFLKAVLSEEIKERCDSSVRLRIKEARFPYVRTFAELDWSAFPIEAADAIRELQSLSFIDEGRNVIFVGNPGVGKTHLAISIGVEACRKNRHVLYVTVPNLITELKESVSKKEYLQYKRKFVSYDLVILDELGYISFDQEGSELLFNLLSNRNDSKSTVITTNLTFDKWPTLFGDTVMTAAMVDRLTNRASVVEILGESYRVKQTKKWLESPK
jgi:DNA replication protein DnaC